MYEHIDEIKTPDFFAVKKSKVDHSVTSQHYHNSFEINFFINVNLEIFIKDMKYDIKDGDIVFINEFEIHRFVYDDESNIYNRYLINFQKDYILPSLKLAGLESVLNNLKDESKFTCISTNMEQRNELEYLFKSMINANNSDTKDSSVNVQNATAKLYLILILVRIYEIFKNNKQEPVLSKQNKLIKNIIQYIDNNYMKKITLDILQDEFFIDKYHICHIFKETTDLSIMKYMQERRIMEAQKRLKNSNKEIIDICYDCGFSNLQHFYRVFKKISGITPDKYRKL